MTRKEAKKLVKPLVWKQNGDGEWVAMVKLYPAATIFIFAHEPEKGKWITYPWVQATLPWKEERAATLQEAQSIAESRYQDFVLGFLNLEGGEK